MGEIRKIKDAFYVEFYARGLLYSQVAGCNLAEAQKLLQEIEAKIAGGEALTIARHIELVDFFERFKAELTQQHYPPKSRERFGCLIEHFHHFLLKEYPHIHQLAFITPAVIESYKLFLMKAQRPKVTNFSILLLREVMEFGIKLGFINDNPALHVRLLPWSNTGKRKLTGRFRLAKQLLGQGIGLGKMSQLLKLSDVAQCLYYANLIPLTVEDRYN